MNLRQIRLNKNYTVPKLAKLSGLSIRTIEEVERRKKCTVDTAKKLASALEVTLDELCEMP
jgi:transcriptional regulator with XRE-family HTH domain